MPSHESYFELLKKELGIKASFLRGRSLASIYFGGGTPSLVSTSLIVDLLSQLEKEGLKRSPDCEVTIEINPATITSEKLERYLSVGINRFSVGAQTFNDALLRSVNREHNAEQTRQTLQLLKSYRVNYSFDILFALAGQTLDILNQDLDEVLTFSPQHVSPYCLTVPEGHPLSKTRLDDELQLEMFALIAKRLGEFGYERYEISNFCLPGFASRHNTLYWNDSEYIGLGLSAHSYLRDSDWGTRFWNASTIGQYQSFITTTPVTGWSSPYSNLPDNQVEVLSRHQSLTDYCHTALRMTSGISSQGLLEKFGAEVGLRLAQQLAELFERGWLEKTAWGYKLSPQGLVLSNQVYAALTFLPGEI